MTAVDLDGRGIDESDIRPETADDLELYHDVDDIGYIFKTAYAVDKNCGRYNGDCRVFGAAYLDFSKKRFSASDSYFAAHIGYRQSI